MKKTQKVEAPVQALRTSDPKPEGVALGPEPPNRGPAWTDLQGRIDPAPLDAKDYCLKLAIGEEWGMLQRIVSERVGREPKGVWEKCSKCGFVYQRAYRDGAELTSSNGPCQKCNRRGEEAKGFFRDMSESEVKSYKDAQVRTRAEVIERGRRAAFYAANEVRQKAGLPVWTRGEFDAAAKVARVRRRDLEAGRMTRPGKAFPEAPGPALQVTQSDVDKVKK
jgi:hypothetical protein